MTNVNVELRNALEPLNPYYLLSIDARETDVEVAVYSPVTHDRTFEAQVTPSYARTLLEGAARFAVNGDDAEYEEFVNALDQLEAGTLREPPKPTCSFADATQFMLDALQRTPEGVHITIEGATWYITR